MRINNFDVEFVDTIPSELKEGVLYISKPCMVGVHLCACGCGEKTVTPFDDQYGWKLSIYNSDKVIVTLRPSIGNYQIPCKSHYYITKSKVEWL